MTSQPIDILPTAPSTPTASDAAPASGGCGPNGCGCNPGGAQK